MCLDLVDCMFSHISPSTTGGMSADELLQEERDREQWEEFEQTWAKRRRLIREKSELDIVPKRRESCSLAGCAPARSGILSKYGWLTLADKPVPKTWADAPKPLDWAAGAVPSTLSAKDAASDLAMMAVSAPLPLQLVCPDC